MMTRTQRRKLIASILATLDRWHTLDGADVTEASAATADVAEQIIVAAIHSVEKYATGRAMVAALLEAAPSEAIAAAADVAAHENGQAEHARAAFALADALGIGDTEAEALLRRAGDA